MGNYTQNYISNLSAEYEVSEILEHFNSQYIFDIIQDKIRNRFTSTIASINNPNIILSFEDNFKRCMAVYPEDIENIDKVRDETYREVIDIITKFYNIKFQYNEEIDPYTYAYYLYDFFVCNFTSNISKFFAEFIFANKDMLYNSLGLESSKKSKESGIAYNKKVYGDDKLATISFYIDKVIYALQSFDITNHDVFTVVYGVKEIVDMLDSSLLVPYELFKLFFSIPEDYNPIMITNTRLYLQSLGVRSSSSGSYI